MNNNQVLRTIGLAIVTIFSGIMGIGSLSIVGQASYYYGNTGYFMLLASIDIVALSVALILSFKNKKSGSLVGLAYAIIGMFTAGINLGNIGLCVGYTLITVYNYSSKDDNTQKSAI